MKLLILTCLIILGMLPACGVSSPDNQHPDQASPVVLSAGLIAELATEFEARRQHYHVPGAAVAIVQGNDIRYAQGFGVRDQTTHQPVTPETVFRVASTTKSMTSMLVATWIDDGLFSWDTPVREIYPAFQLPTPHLTQQLTIRQLLNMGSGLGDGIHPAFWGDYQPADLLAALNRLPQLSAGPGHYHYVNELYSVAGYLGPLAAGLSEDALLIAYRQAMQSRIYDPIGMTTARLAVDPATVSDNYAVSYGPYLADGPTGLIRQPYMDNTAIAPAGQTITHVEDMARYLITHLNRGVVPDGRRVVLAANLAETWHPQTIIDDHNAYGLGWHLETVKGIEIRWHRGDIAGFHSQIVLLPQAEIGLVILTNSLAGEFLATETRYRLLELLYGWPPLSPRQHPARQYEAVLAEFAHLISRLEATTVPLETVQPYLGDYEFEVRVSRQPDGSLWLTRRSWQLALMPTAEGYLIGSGPSFRLMGQTVQFIEEAGDIKLVLAAGDDAIKVKQLNGPD